MDQEVIPGQCANLVDLNSEKPHSNDNSRSWSCLNLYSRVSVVGEGLGTLCSLFNSCSHIKVMGPVFLPINLCNVCKPFCCGLNRNDSCDIQPLNENGLHYCLLQNERFKKPTWCLPNVSSWRHFGQRVNFMASLDIYKLKSSLQ